MADDKHLGCPMNSLRDAVDHLEQQTERAKQQAAQSRRLSTEADRKAALLQRDRSRSARYGD